ncbi:MAG: MFS transporter [Elusimicrobia bacterium]|jgi:acyl-[acyl-carrier-protein]-phospholipid O-acyltransferase/long-chain-fatty-acid--[acyl-carrier-protein] ligase|nr:MFS transporter [Elusimicrobiota bacterium]MBK7573895.1 MFS transporter [Elusimicrobiota bacterium]MBK8422658.1 MFS transporter [Elusimicrobiota bacterium]MBK9695072.1 MFS transporter [Elusimicrobiota bacterium]MBK9923381.1 MFS transporter [Elusimicrobiota bacterium]
MTDRSTRSFRALMTAQFFAAFNDNVFQAVAALLIVRWRGEAASRELVALSGLVFALPFLMFSLAAGRLADRWSKARVVVLTKTVDIGVVALLLIGLFQSSVAFLMTGLFLLAAQSAFFGPAKYGLLPELKGADRLTQANALLNATTFVAILGGNVAGALLTNHLWAVALLTGVGALLSLGAATLIEKVPPANPAQEVRWNPLPDIVANTRLIRGDRALFRAVLALSWFWFLGGVLHLNAFTYVKQVMNLGDAVSGLFLTAVVIGISLGSLAAGKMSKEKVELGLVPLGAVGMSVFTLDLFFAHGSLVRVLIDAGLMGFFSGLFVIPLTTLVQLRSPEKERGRVLSTLNFFSFVAILLGSAFLWAASKIFKTDPAQVFFVLGVLSSLAALGIAFFIPQAPLRLFLYGLTHLIYRIKVIGRENVPTKGAALLLPNHVSYVDPFLIGGATSRWIRFLMFRGMFEIPWIKPFVRLMDVIPISANDRPKQILGSLQEVRHRLEDGHVACVFAEGAVTRLAQTLGFRKGFERIVEGLDVPLVPVHLDRVWGSVFSFERGSFVWKLPRQLPYPVTISFGRPLPSTAKADEVRQAVLDLGAAAFEHRLDALRPLHQHFFRQARRQWLSPCLSDTTGLRLSYGKLATGALLLSRRLNKILPPEKNVGVLLPPGGAAAVVNLALLFAGRVPVNLNYSLGRGVVDQICREAGITALLTARKMLEAVKWGDDARAVFLEDLPRAPKPKALAAFLAFRLMPARWVERLVAPHSDVGVDDLAALLFTSGSTGTPKGVMLTHRNIHANIQGLQETFQLSGRDTLLGVLPFFHSFGFTGTFWLPLLSGCQVAYHRSPLEPVAIKKMIKEESVTVLIATPTFLQMWFKKLDKDDVKRLRFALTGAEKLQQTFAREFQETLGVPIIEGYGTTELSPVACVSVLSVRHATEYQIGNKPGKVGRPLPGVSVRIVHPETGARLPDGQPGLMLIKGPNVMRGYWNQPEKTAEAIRDGWYVTGDIAAVDEDGFVEITDRLSRFSKIGGEMVPHMLVERRLAELSGEPEAQFLVLSLPDEKKGEKLAVLYYNLRQPPDQLLARLAASDMPKLWVPDRRMFVPVDEWPTLASGKVDTVKAKAVARRALETS